MPRLLPPILALALLATACSGPTAAPRVVASVKPKASATPGPKATNPLVKPIALETERRPVGLGGVAVTLAGRVQLLSDQGAGIISNNSGAIISDNGGGLVSNNGGGLSSDKGGAIISDNGAGYHLAQAPTSGAAAATRDGGARAENVLADADVELLDGRGRLLVDDKGRPLGARTDNTGAFKFTGELPPEALVARVRLWQGGVLLAMVAPRQAGVVAIDLDTASTLGAAYVLERFVKQRQDVYDRLPAAEAAALRREVEAARAGLGDAVPSYEPAALAAATEALKAKAPAVDQRLERIRAILLVGQADVGNGRPAKDVALSFPLGLADDGAGGFLVGEFAGGRVRRVDAAGAIGRYVGGSRLAKAEGPLLDVAIDSPADLVRAADGTVYVADELGARVLAIRDGQVKAVAGTGVRGQTPTDGPATAVPLFRPVSVAPAADGTLWIAENTRSDDNPCRLMRVDPDGTMHVEPLPRPRMSLPAVAIGADGALWIADNETGTAWVRPAGGAWRQAVEGLPVENYARMRALPDGRMAITADVSGQVFALGADGTRTVLAGDGTPGFAGDGGPASAARLSTPAGLMLAADGALLVADAGNGVIRRLAPPLDGSGTITTVAGTFGVSQQGDAVSIAINLPGGMARDAQGRLVLTEGAGHTVKRLDDGRLTLLAGSGQGFEGDGGPAVAARLNAPSGVAAVGDALYVLDLVNVRIRKIDAAGRISTVVGAGVRGEGQPGRTPAASYKMRAPVACAGAPDGRLYWVDTENSQISRLNLDGTAEVVAGANWQGGDAGDGGPAREAVLNQPAGLAFDSRGDLYVADAGNMRVRRISGLAGDAPRIDAFIGIAGFGALFDAPSQAGDVPGDQAALIAPAGLAFAPDDTLYVSEMGTGRLKTAFGSRGLTVGELPVSGARIRRVTGVREGKPVLRTIAGEGTGLLDQPGTDDSLVLPAGLIFDAQRGLFVMDTGNNAIRLIPKALL